MRVFVTGSTGFIGSAVVKELLSAGHTVLGLTRSDKGVEQLKDQGADVLRGTIEDLELLKKGASESDAVIHLAFVHNFTDYMGSCAIDRAAITAMGSALAAAGGDRALIITSGTMMLARVKVGDEDDAYDSANPMAAARGASEPVCLDFAKQGVRAMVVRPPPTTHGFGVSGFTGMLVGTALKTGVSAYIGDGENRWAACACSDAARVYRLAVEKGKAGAVYHPVAEEGVPLKDVAAEVGKQLGIPVVSVEPEKTEEHFGWFRFGAMADNPASSAKTRERLGWEPTGPSLVEDVHVVIDFMKTHPPKY